MAKSIRSWGGYTPQLDEGVFVDPSAVVLGDVIIGEHSSVWPCAVVRGDTHRIRIGARTSVQDNSTLHTTHPGQFNPDGHPLSIGDEVTIGHGVTLHGCTIGNQVLIGIGTTVLDGAVVEDQVLIGAGSLVPPGKRLESGHMYVGSPVQKKRALSDKEKAHFSYSANYYCGLKDQHLSEPDTFAD
jgi:carbonic anhydrase/acetyltransferase-like protein (isoleucine patch superfamily)